jgi:NagD protein
MATTKLVDGFVFDLDGTVYLGESALPGAVEGIRDLRNRNKRVVFVSNKPLDPRQAYARKLTRLGIPTHPNEVITSAFVLGRHLARTEPHLRLYVIGEPTLVAELRGHGLTVLDEFGEQDPRQVIDATGIDAVVVAFDRTLDYRKLNTAYQALRKALASWQPMRTKRAQCQTARFPMPAPPSLPLSTSVVAQWSW